MAGGVAGGINASLFPDDESSDDDHETTAVAAMAAAVAAAQRRRLSEPQEATSLVGVDGGSGGSSNGGGSGGSGGGGGVTYGGIAALTDIFSCQFIDKAVYLEQAGAALALIGSSDAQLFYMAAVRRCPPPPTSLGQPPTHLVPETITGLP